MCDCGLPPLGATILEPGFHLSIGHFEATCQSGSFRRSQILLFMEALFQLGHLNASERGAWLFPLWRSAVLIWMADASGDRKSGCKDNRIFNQ